MKDFLSIREARVQLLEEMVQTIILIIAVIFAHHLVCFDTGDHFDITEIALLKFNYSNEAIREVQVANYLTDVFSQKWFTFTRGIRSHNILLFT